MSDLDIWLSILLLTAGTVMTRATFWLVGHHVTIPKRIHEALRFAPACALAAIIFPDLLISHGELAVSVHNPRLIAGIVASAYFLWKRGMFSTIVLGMAVFSLIRLAI